jgi:hypothetical protein
MADWRQIQARIRKAKNSPDAPTKLAELYTRTRDAMVAWELALIGEKAAQNDEAVKWYTISAERFRRPEWKKKAEEALSRLGAALPVPLLKPNTEENTESFHIPAQTSQAMPLALGEIPEAEEEEETAAEIGEALESPEELILTAKATGLAVAAPNGDAAKKRRRGRRGGRGRRRKGPIAAPALPTQAFAEPVEAASSGLPPVRMAVTEITDVDTSEENRITPVPVRREIRETRPVRRPEPVRINESDAPRELSIRSSQGRAGDPALASRMVYLDSMLRRLVSGAPHRLDQADGAPAGPGVFLLSDSDQIASYYIEACQTLRVGLANLVRGGRSGKNVRSGGRTFTDSGLKANLAEHLGISESKVGQYMKDHCVVRWIQLDDDAYFLAHFAIGVLKTPLNLE